MTFSAVAMEHGVACHIQHLLRMQPRVNIYFCVLTDEELYTVDRILKAVQNEVPNSRAGWVVVIFFEKKMTPQASTRECQCG